MSAYKTFLRIYDEVADPALGLYPEAQNHITEIERHRIAWRWSSAGDDASSARMACAALGDLMAWLETERDVDITRPLAELEDLFDQLVETEAVA